MTQDKIGLASLTPALKSIFLILCILGVIVPCVLGFVNLDMRIDSVEVCQDAGNKKDVSQDKKIVDLEKREIERKGEYAMLRADSDRQNTKLDVVLSELKRLERGE